MCKNNPAWEICVVIVKRSILSYAKPYVGQMYSILEIKKQDNYYGQIMVKSKNV